MPTSNVSWRTGGSPAVWQRLHALAQASASHDISYVVMQLVNWLVTDVFGVSRATPYPAEKIRRALTAVTELGEIDAGSNAR